jgi:hypothetical protein
MEIITLEPPVKKEEHWWRKSTVFGGFDVGKRGNPSHCSIFAIEIKEEKLTNNIIMIHQKFLDNWEYTRQVGYLTSLIDYFHIQRLYYDATRGELEERSLPRECIPIILSNRTGPRAKGKLELATNFAKLVEQKRIRLLNDDRFISQITCVSGDLEAPNTPKGHGDSFISIMLAVGVYFDYFAPDKKMGSSTICNVQDIIKYSDGNIQTPNNNIGYKKSFDNTKCKICGGINFDVTSDGLKKICKKCYTIW